MGGSSGSGSSKQKTTIPTELRPLYTQTGQRIQEFQTRSPLTDFAKPNPLNIAPISGREQQSFEMLPGVTNIPEQERLALSAIQSLPGLAQRRARGEGLTNFSDSPAIKAALEAFTMNTEPALINQTKLMGLGNSSAVTNALSRSRANLLLPLIQDELGREERGIERELGATQAQVAPLMGLGQTEREAYLRQLAGLQQAGATERGVEQDAYNAAQQDFLRQQALSEQALFGPMGQLPSTFGQKVSSTTSQGK